MLTDALIAPFTEFEFMRRALAAVIALSLGGAPIGVFLMLRRMSLVGDAMAHAILPMPPKGPVVRQRPVPTKSNTEIGKLLSISALCGR